MHIDPAGGRRSAGELEAAVLATLQAAGVPLSPGEVRDRLGADLAYSTVVTILSRLHDKGVLERRKAGRAYAYTPVTDEPGLAARRMVRVLDGEADREAVLARFVSGLSEGDEDLLRRMLSSRETPVDQETRVDQGTRAGQETRADQPPGIRET